MSSLFPLYGSWDSNSGYQAWGQNIDLLRCLASPAVYGAYMAHLVLVMTIYDLIMQSSILQVREVSPSPPGLASSAGGGRTRNRSQADWLGASHLCRRLCSFSLWAAVPTRGGSLPSLVWFQGGL